MPEDTQPAEPPRRVLLERTAEDDVAEHGMGRAERRRYRATRRLEARRAKKGWGERPPRPKKKVAAVEGFTPGRALMNMSAAMGQRAARHYTAAIPSTPDGDRLRAFAEAAYVNALAAAGKDANEPPAHWSCFDLHEAARRVRRELRS